MSGVSVFVEAGGSTYVKPVAAVFLGLLLVLPCAWLAARRRSGPEAPMRPHLLRQARGVVMVLLVVVLFTTSTMVTQLIFEAEKYRKPFFVTLLCFSSQSIYLLGYRSRTIAALAAVCRRLCPRGLCARRVSRRSGPPGRYGYDEVVALEDAEPAGDRPANPANGSAAAAAPAARSLFGGLGALGVAWRLGATLMASNLLFNASLQFTSVSASTVISSSSAVWTLLLSAWWLGEPLTPMRVGSVLCGSAGVLIVVYGDGGGGGGHVDHHHALGNSAHHTLGRLLLAGGYVSSGRHWLGNMGMSLSAVCYGAYSVQLRREVPSERETPLPFLFGLMGLSALALSPPALLALHLCGAERFVPPTAEALAVVRCRVCSGSSGAAVRWQLSIRWG